MSRAGTLHQCFAFARGAVRLVAIIALVIASGLAIGIGSAFIWLALGLP